MNINQIDELAQADKTLRASRYDGYDLVKTGCVGYVLGRVRWSRVSLIDTFSFTVSRRAYSGRDWRRDCAWHIRQVAARRAICEWNDRKGQAMGRQVMKESITTSRSSKLQRTDLNW